MSGGRRETSTRCSSLLAIAERTYGDRLDPAARFFVEEVLA